MEELLCIIIHMLLIKTACFPSSAIRARAWKMITEISSLSRVRVISCCGTEAVQHDMVAETCELCFGPEN